MRGLQSWDSNLLCTEKRCCDTEGTAENSREAEEYAVNTHKQATTENAVYSSAGRVECYAASV